MASLPITSIRTDGGTQPRSTIDFGVVEDYATAMADGATLPPLTVFYDGQDHWLADGFHRRAAAETLGLAEVECDVRQGTRRDAVLFSVGANAAHGMRRTNEDKRRSVLTLLNDAEWAKWSDGEIARKCAVSQPFVSKIRPAPPPSQNHYEMPRQRTVERAGTVYQQNTARIGSNPPPRADRPVFDATASGERGPAWSPAEIPSPPAPVPFVRDKSGDYIHNAMMAVLGAMAKMPDPLDAAVNYPRDVWHALPLETVEEIAAWWAAFLPLWAAGAQNRADYLERFIKIAKEKAVGIAH